MRIGVPVLSVALLLAGIAAQGQTVAPRLPRLAPAPVNGVEKPKRPAGGVEVLSDTQGVEFKPYLLELQKITKASWAPLIPEEMNPPTCLAGEALIRFKVLPNGRVMEGSMELEGRSGATVLDRAAWDAITSSDYPPLPEEFKGPYLELRFLFRYNMDQKPLTDEKPAEAADPVPNQAPDREPDQQDSPTEHEPKQ
jgi:hypothetical protein